MSVPKSEQEEGELLAYTKAKDLLNYTYQITINNFTKEDDNEDIKADHKWLCDEIRRMCLYITLDILTANKKRLDNEYESNQRLILQNGVDAMYERLSSMVNMAHEQSLVKSKRVKAWDKKIEDALIVLRSWKKSDRERIKNKQFKK